MEVTIGEACGSMQRGVAGYQATLWLSTLLIITNNVAVTKMCKKITNA